MKKRLKDFIVDPKGQWNHPGKNTFIPNANGSITMRDVKYPVLGIDDEGNQQMMYPDQEYQFPGNGVYEIPMAQSGGTFNPDTDEFIGFADELPKAQIGGILNSIHPMLNPYNWGVNDYSNKNNFDQAYESAKKAGDQEFLFNNKRYNTKYAGTPRQEVGRYGVNGQPVDIDNSIRLSKYPSMSMKYMGHIAAENDGNVVDYGPSGNFKSSTQDVEKNYNVYNANKKLFNKVSKNLPIKLDPFKEEKNPNRWTLATNNCADNVCDAFGIPRSKGIQTPGRAMDKIKNKYPTLDVTGRTYDDYENLYKELQKQPHKKILAQADNLLGIASSPEIQKSGLSKNFISTIQGVLANEGYDLSKSLREDGNYDGVYGPETKQALADWQSKNKNKKQEGGTFNPDTDEFIRYSDSLHKFQTDGQYNKDGTIGGPKVTTKGVEVPMMSDGTPVVNIRPVEISDQMPDYLKVYDDEYNKRMNASKALQEKWYRGQDYDEAPLQKRAEMAANDAAADFILKQRRQQGKSVNDFANRQEYLKSFSDKERSIIENSNFAGNLGPDAGTQFRMAASKIIQDHNPFRRFSKRKDSNLLNDADVTQEDYDNASRFGLLSPFSVPVNAVKSLFKGDSFKDAVKGETQSPWRSANQLPLGQEGDASVWDAMGNGVFDPLNLTGIGLAEGVFDDVAKNTGKFLTTKTPLKNTYKLNPSALKEKDVDMLWRWQADNPPAGLLKENAVPAEYTGRWFQKGDATDVFDYMKMRPGSGTLKGVALPKGVATLPEDAAKFTGAESLKDVERIVPTEALQNTTDFRLENNPFLPGRVDNPNFVEDFADLQPLFKNAKITPHWFKGYSPNIKPTNIPEAVTDLAKPAFQSEIDWAKWNPEIASNQKLLDEYSAIEQQAKADGTWMKYEKKVANDEKTLKNKELFDEQEKEFNIKKTEDKYKNEAEYAAEKSRIYNEEKDALLNSKYEEYFNDAPKMVKQLLSNPNYPGAKEEFLRSRGIKQKEIEEVLGSLETNVAKREAEIAPKYENLPDSEYVRPDEVVYDTTLEDFTGTPEQFVQSNSENFKKAYPEGWYSTYRGGDVNPELYTNHGKGSNVVFTTTDQYGAKVYNRMGDINEPLSTTEAPQRGLTQLYAPNTKNKIVIDGDDSYIHDGRLITGQRKNYARLNTLNQKPVTTLQRQNLDAFNKHMRINYPDVKLNDRVHTDHFADFLNTPEGKHIDRVEFKKILDGTQEPIDVEVNNFHNNRRLKSMWNNNGMFDMNNPNIYKSILPAIGTGALGLGALENYYNNKQKYGGSFNPKTDQFLSFVD